MKTKIKQSAKKLLAVCVTIVVLAGLVGCSFSGNRDYSQPQSGSGVAESGRGEYATNITLENLAITVTLEEDATIDTSALEDNGFYIYNNVAVVIPSGSTLTIPKDATLEILGAVFVEGTIVCEGKILNKSILYIAESGKVTGTGTLLVNEMFGPGVNNAETESTFNNNALFSVNEEENFLEIAEQAMGRSSKTSWENLLLMQEQGAFPVNETTADLFDK